jgi:hypothetical protein
MSTLWSASTPCPACGRDTATTEDGRCHSCGALKTADAEPEPAAAAPPLAPSVWEDMRPQLVAAAISALIAVLGLLAGSSLLLLLAAAVLVVAAVAKIVADGW